MILNWLNKNYVELKYISKKNSLLEILSMKWLENALFIYD
jgi:hypothetical protein